MKKKVIASVLVIIALFFNMPAQEGIPRLQKQGTATQLIVNNKPFLVLGGELGNSTASDLNYLKPYWDNFIRMNVNTILTPVYWELIEPEEGKFDFKLLDNLILDARKSNIKLVLLWFGA
jgi:beta-galactosidase GanA